MQNENKPSWRKNRVTAELDIEYPIIQGALGGFSSERLTSAVSNFGALGTFGAYSKDPEGIRQSIAQIRSLTSRPFAVNLWVSMEDEAAFRSSELEFQRSLSHIENELRALSAQPPKFEPYHPANFEDQVSVLIEARVPAFSFIFGIPRREVLDEFRRIGTTIIGTATTVAEAKALEDAGVHIVVASGFEAGGHRGSFLREAEESLTGTFSLVPQVADAISLPLVAAGGVADARGVRAAFALGAEAVQMGTAFLACEGSGATDTHRSIILNGEASLTGLTRGFTGRLARGVRNRMMEMWNSASEDILPYPLQRQMVRALSIPAQAAGRSDLIPLWAGQSASLTRHSDATEFLKSLVSEIERETKLIF
ncbi:NAD(P)H-dependent flavin oxidoreductase [Silvibacterium acidisoli]|uniref:NAD(P)H-dependent flavin oxidoreductase n=1 Tax=Acidobacteriaceae bacterium ZG23-2 TaxID=2883246 RepID=UPI00406C7E0C